MRGQGDQAEVQDGARHQALPQRLPQGLQQRCFAGQWLKFVNLAHENKLFAMELARRVKSVSYPIGFNI